MHAGLYVNIREDLLHAAHAALRRSDAPVTERQEDKHARQPQRERETETTFSLTHSIMTTAARRRTCGTQRHKTKELVHQARTRQR
jgi:hypothetical protein